MGASTFSASVYAPSAEEGYDLLVAEAHYEYGHDPFNGTISTTEGFIEMPFGLAEDSEDWMERVFDSEEVRKWGPCACVEATHIEKNDKGWPLWHFAGWAAE